ncbi:uncharacterized protein LOC144450808 [Glandiceps talaboti]
MARYSSRLTLLVLSIVLLYVIPPSNATDSADIEIVYSAVNSIHDIIPLDFNSGLEAVIVIRNNGPTDIAAGTTDNNFAVRAYLSDAIASFSNTTATTVSLVDLTQSSDLLKQAVNVSHFRALTFDNTAITIDSTTCKQLAYFCVEVLHDNTTGFTDVDPLNNFACKEFGIPITHDERIGIYKCHIDIEATSAAMVTASSDITYQVGVAQTVTFNVTIKNNGGKPLTTPLKPKVYLTDSGELESASAGVKEEQGEVNHEYTDTVAEGQNIHLSPPFEVSITIPLASDICNAVTHVCIEIISGSTSYDDHDSTNNDYCLEIGPVADGKVGVKTDCPVNGIDLQVTQFEVNDWENTVYDIGQPTAITIDGNITNMGDEEIFDSTSMNNNYGFEVYLMSSSNVNVGCTVDLADTMNLKDGLAFDNVLAIGAISATCTIPADTALCMSYESLCVKVVVDSAYTEALPNNNFLCQQFGDLEYVGNKRCPILNVDIEPSQAIVTPSVVPYPLDTPTNATINITITNTGPGNLPTVLDPNVNFVVTVYLSESEDLYPATGTRQEPVEDAFVVNESDLMQGIDKDGEINLLVSAPVNLDASSCEQLVYLCVQVTLHSSSIYTDIDANNKFFCVQFKPPGDGQAGNTECFVDLDINVTHPIVTSPTNLEYKPGFETDVEITFYVTNNGGLSIPATDDGNNFVAKVYLNKGAYLNSDKTPVSTTNGEYSLEISGKATDLAIPGISLKITIPTLKARCEELTHVCISIAHEDSKYIDSDPTNDVICVEFGSVYSKFPGIKNCDVDIDLSVTSLTVRPSLPVYEFDEDVATSIDVGIANNGDGDLTPAMSESVNYDLEFFFTNNANLEDASNVIRVDARKVMYDAVALSVGVLSGADIVLKKDDAQINIPLEDCLSITHICVNVTLNRNDLVFSDPDSTNNDACLEFGDYNDEKAGIIPCFIDLGIVDIDVTKPNKPKYQPNKAYTLDIQLSVRNYGSVGVGHTPSDNEYNFRPLVYLSSSMDIDSASTLLKQDDVMQDGDDLRWEHEVGTGVTVLLDIFQISITIPGEDCTKVSYLCLKIEHEGWYDDGYEPNDKKCIPFVAGQGGEIVCSADPPDPDDTFGLPITYTIVIIVVVVLAVLIGVTVGICNGCRKKRPKYVA